MFCPFCGTENPDSARFCSNCGQAAQGQQPPPFEGAGQQGPSSPPGSSSPAPPYLAAPTHIDNNLVWAILATICCCMPTGIVAIVYAAQVNGKLRVGDYQGARRYADNAKNWAIVSAVVTAIVYAIGLFIGIVGEFWL